MTGAEWVDRTSSDEWLRYRAEVSSPLAEQGERVLCEYLMPASVQRVLDLGCGAGRLLEAIRARVPAVSVVGVDISADLLEEARRKFPTNHDSQFLIHDLMNELSTSLGTFDAIVSSLAIHHVPHDRKAMLYREAFSLLNPGGTFSDLDCDKMPTRRLKKMFRSAHKIDRSLRHPSDQPAPLDVKLEWLEAAGFEDSNCYWHCLGMSLVGGRRPLPAQKQQNSTG